MAQTAELMVYLEDCRRLVLDEIRTIVPDDTRHSGDLYALMLDYPLRHGKSLRPALSIAVCRAAGGSLAAVVPTAAVLELYHNAFLIHDDVEDRSDMRRSEATLHRLHGMPTAVNVGDGMLALTIRPLLDNIGRIGLGKALKILRIVSRMARESAEGQMLELGWIRDRAWDQCDDDYVRLVHKKTGWYSFMAPVMVGAVTAGLPDAEAERLGRLFIPLGIAFQIQDDVLNLVADPEGYGKDSCGDLWEGKHTLILIHALRSSSPGERGRAIDILAKPHPGTILDAPRNGGGCAIEVLDELVAANEMSPRARARVLEALCAAPEAAPKTESDIDFLRELVARRGSVAYARGIAQRYAERFHRDLQRALAGWPGSSHGDFLRELAEFTINRPI